MPDGKSRPFTVVGYYDDTGLAYCGHFMASDRWNAAVACAEAYADDPLVIIGVFAGKQAMEFVSEQERGVFACDVLNADSNPGVEML